jgi:DNA-binding transcriptional LysR family regulator
MEQTLGVQLFSRESRQTLPTAIGLPVIEQARVMLGALQTIRQTVDSVRPMLRGTIRLQVFPWSWRVFCRRCCASSIACTPGSKWWRWRSAMTVETLLAAGVDRCGAQPGPERNAGPLGRDEWVAVVPTGHPLALRGTEQGVTCKN